MKNFNILIFNLLVITFAACSSTQFKTEYDKSTDFSALKTYSWGENSIELKKGPNTTDVILKQVATMVRDDIQPIVNQEFTKKGLQQVDDVKADMIIEYVAIGDMTNEVRQNVPTNVVSGTSMEQAGALMLGTLTLNVVTPDTRKTIWSGKCDAFITGDGTDNTRLKKILAELLKDFPPASNKK